MLSDEECIPVYNLLVAINNGEEIDPYAVRQLACLLFDLDERADARIKELEAEFDYAYR